MTSSRFDRIAQQRIAKLEQLRNQGINPYPHRFHRSHSAAEAASLLKQQETSGEANANPVDVAGRIMAIRKMGKGSFIDLRDGSGKIQLLYQDTETTTAQQRELFAGLDIGDFIGAEGTLFRTRTGEATVRVAELAMLAKSLRPLPEKWHGLSDVEIRYRQRYLDLISNPEVKKTFETRSQIVAGVRQFLNQRGFLEVETPILQPEAGGASARPFVTHHNTLDQDFYLRIATELHLKRLIVGGFDKVYELGRAFRNEGIDTRHNPEFTLLESYEAYADYNDVMKMVEDMVSTIAQQVLGTTQVKFGEHTINLTPPWQRLGLREAIQQSCGIDIVKFPKADLLRTEMQKLKMETDPTHNWAKLVDDLLTACVEPNLIQPTFLIDYPVSMSPLAKTRPDNERVVERFEGFAGGLELANAFTELNDPLEQRERFVQQQKEHRPEDTEQETIDEDFLQAMEYGMPPTGGLGIGIDRLVMLLTNQPSIREVILFPQLKEKP